MNANVYYSIKKTISMTISFCTVFYVCTCCKAWCQGPKSWLEIQQRQSALNRYMYLPGYLPRYLTMFSLLLHTFSYYHWLNVRLVFAQRSFSFHLAFVQRQFSVRSASVQRKQDGNFSVTATVYSRRFSLTHQLCMSSFLNSTAHLKLDNQVHSQKVISCLFFPYFSI